ncbi:hypothetical protein WN51_11101 [Melipona quadrifasciata]|uniref:Uncharacterized protein n=1 Tax=Melipona quadrifasciata TaxID=166423 RepID=A0A0N0U617_9HYME|nr:hypothetical protein WN51_11101 [Melipona quadrifasciata]
MAAKQEREKGEKVFQQVSDCETDNVKEKTRGGKKKKTISSSAKRSSNRFSLTSWASLQFQ